MNILERKVLVEARGWVGTLDMEEVNEMMGTNFDGYCVEWLEASFDDELKNHMDEEDREEFTSLMKKYTIDWVKVYKVLEEEMGHEMEFGTCDTGVWDSELKAFVFKCGCGHVDIIKRN